MCWRQVDRYYMANDFGQTISKSFDGGKYQRVWFSGWHRANGEWALLGCFTGDGALEQAKAACRERRGLGE